MNIKFNATQEQKDLVRLMGSNNKVESETAQEVFAALMSPVLSKVYNQADTTQFLYRQLAYGLDEDPSWPLDPLRNTGLGHFKFWAQTQPGGLASNLVSTNLEEIKFQTYQIDGAISYYKKWARKVRLDVLAMYFERLMQEVLHKTNTYAWNVFLIALAQATHSVRINNVASTGHVFASAAAGQFTLDDFNKLLTFFRRLNTSFSGGTPTEGVGKPTDIVISPELMEQFRAMAYNPINTQGGNRTAITANSQQSAGAVVALSDAERSSLFSSGGIPSFYGINVIELLELGPGQSYQTLFANYIGSTTLPYIGASGSSVQFVPSTNNLVIVLDASKPGAVRVIQTDNETGSVFTLSPDDQFVSRSGKIGNIGALNEGRAVLETRGMAALVV
jgi:hypothetical protein